MNAQKPAQFVLTLQAPAAADGVRLLRHALKVLLRRYGLRCTSVRELHDTAGTQSELFDSAAGVAPAPTDPLHGLSVRLPTACRCYSELAVIGPGKSPHAASLHCCECETHRGWIGHQTHKFLTETINQFGRPTEPIILRRQPPVPPAVGDSAERLNRNETS